MTKFLGLIFLTICHDLLYYFTHKSLFSSHVLIFCLIHWQQILCLKKGTKKLFQSHHRELIILIRILQSSITPTCISMIPDYSLSSSLKRVSSTLICVTYQSLQRLRSVCIAAWSSSNKKKQKNKKMSRPMEAASVCVQPRNCLAR